MSAKSLMFATTGARPFGGAAAAQTAVTFGTNWVAQAEHGGFYQASSTAPMPNAGST
jgi:NitT/TauT family transport system substrate-binding protein